MNTSETEKTDRYGAVEKCRAVLSVWTERKKASILCREMGISASLLSQWQERALSGILESLEPRGTREIAGGPAIPQQVKRLLEKKVREREITSLGRMAQWRPRQEKRARTEEESKAAPTPQT